MYLGAPVLIFTWGPFISDLIYMTSNVLNKAQTCFKYLSANCLTAYFNIVSNGTDPKVSASVKYSIYIYIYIYIYIFIIDQWGPGPLKVGARVL